MPELKALIGYLKGLDEKLAYMKSALCFIKRAMGQKQLISNAAREGTIAALFE